MGGVSVCGGVGCGGVVGGGVWGRYTVHLSPSLAGSKAGMGPCLALLVPGRGGGRCLGNTPHMGLHGKVLGPRG